jgi:hypothetical protein
MMPPRSRTTSQGEKVFIRLLAYDDPETIGFEFVTLTRRADGGWDTASRTSRHVLLPVGSVREAMEAIGLERVEAFGAHDGMAFDADRDESVILVGYRS